MLTDTRIHVDLESERFWRDGVPVPVTPKIFRLIRIFVIHPGKLLTTETLLSLIWPDTNVAECSVKDCIKQLRALLNDDARNPRFIETVRGRGYRYCGGIVLLSEGETPPATSEVETTDASPERPARKLLLLNEARNIWEVLDDRRWGALAALAFLVLVTVVIVTFVGAKGYDLDQRSSGYLAAGEADRFATPVVAILPFEPLSEGRRVQLLAGAFTTGVASALARAPDLLVVKGAADDIREAGEGSSAVGITHILSGAVQMNHDRLRFTAMLEDATSGRYLWSERQDLRVEDALTLQDKVAQNVYGELRALLVEGDRARIRVRNTDSLDAWLLSHEAYGEYLKFEQTANLRARELWSRAAALDPRYATPVAGLALTHWADAKWGWSDIEAESLLTAKRLAEETIAINSDEPLGHQALGTILFQLGQPEEAITHRRRAMELAPGDFSVVAGLAIRLNEYERHKEAIPLFERSLRLSPRPPWWVYAGYGIALHLDDRADEALRAYDMALAAGSARVDLYARKAAAYVDTGDLRSAAYSRRRVMDLAPEFSIDTFLRTDGFHSEDLNLWLADLLTRAGLPE